ncbi:MAG: protein translocase subunit SecD, partial [Clostridia bacterium]|nr:protein translocase subunit SecD [Clostridia bacterium]
KYEYSSVFDQISKGIDLEGGYYAVLEPKAEDAEFEEKINDVISTLRKRLDNKGYTEAVITIQGNLSGNGRSLRVEIPHVDNPDEVMKLIGSQGELTFRDSAGTVYLRGKNDISGAKVGYDQDGNYAVVLSFTAQGQEKFSNVTKAIKDMSDNKMSIYLGDEVVSSPKVEKQITDSSALITGDFDYDEAESLAAVISSGALEVDFNVTETRQVSASLGSDVVKKAEIAAGIGMLVIFAILIIFYGGMGLAASIALMIYVILYVIVLALFPWVQLTFPGIAGIILSIGMAVDANVIIFERIKEEFASGKTVTNAIHVGFRRAFITILDSNVTTILASIVLWILSSGSIQGFAITLFLGTLVSMFTSIVITRWILNLFRPLSKNEEKFYGLKGGKQNG